MYLFAIQALPQLFHQWCMGNPFFASSNLSLSDRKFFKKVYSCPQPFIMFNAHDNKVTFAIRGQINRLVLFVT